MKRDMDLIRQILLRFEASESEHTKLGVMSDLAPEPLLAGHVQLLRDSQFLEKVRSYPTYDRTALDELWRITSAGHDFLDSIRDPEIWRKTKSGAGQLGGWTLRMLGELANGFIRAKAQELGLPIG